MIGTEKLQISANAVIDYSKPYQTVHTQMSASRFPSEFSTSGDYRFRSEIRTIQVDSVYGSFRLNASASDNWGQPLEIWFTVLNESTGQYLYDSGWTLSPIVNEAVQVTSSTATLRTYFRIRYPEGKGTNPIGNSYFSGAEWSITYDRLVQTEDTIPSYWLGTDTQPTMSAATLPIDTTTVTIAPSEIEQFNPFEIQGFPSSWSGFVTYLTIVLDEMPWIPILIGFFGLCSILWWLLM